MTGGGEGVATVSQDTPAGSAGSSGLPSRPAWRRRFRMTDRQGWVAAIFLAPWFTGLALITIGPIVASAYLSMTEYSLIDSPDWIGFDNFRRMAEDPRFYHALRVT